ncbi:class I SAM-dependent methyltransferase [Gordonia rhizosphera]|uniref:Putative methyltransferase n=1 Tax=Gordonia rhizosphera NBRC 16068 TaxID=1108045 RepID=K6WNS3_9ACTN|nr:class I SAM-dependent methyltransferase [Gordonia rhizosphera]GAB88184.1 putative methyltransferase [Gordonia rhizosphera NBRC 16068]
MTTNTVNQRIFAAWYPGFMSRVERSGQAAIRAEQLSHAHGRTLEIGAGNGLSISHYPDDLEELVLLEPNPRLRARLAARTDGPGVPTTVCDGDAHALDFPDSSFDTVTASLVFCSVTDPARALAEVHRVLRPGGLFLFHEHVRGTGARGFLQDLLNPLQQLLADGCHANRDFVGELRASALHVDEISHLRMPTAMPTIVPLVIGSARRVSEDERTQTRQMAESQSI